ncbi:MAG: SusD/RagB family nutrient-binding outer membrane lipoprotein, partial [Muribaculaceae bacterium]|nr:SusD/RagB family nutrient-binding outer membrane lipoprotein [Muribaculaceae bacterium]
DVQVAINDTRIAAFLNGHLAGWDNNPDHERLIAEQKYLSLFWVGFEAYHELRRTGYPVISIGKGCTYNNREYPQRLFYPTNTVGSNSANVQEALDRMGGENNLRTAVWWSYKAINGTFTAKLEEEFESQQ